MAIILVFCVAFSLFGTRPAIALEANDQSDLEPVVWDPVTFVAIPRLGDPSLSPDGEKLLLVRTTVDWSINKSIDNYQLVDVESGAVENLPHWQKEGASLSDGMWSPDGKGFLTLLKREGDENRAAYFYDITTRALHKVLDHVEDIGDITWANDGKTFYFRAERHDDRPKNIRRLAIEPFDVSTPRELWKYDLSKELAELILAGGFSVRNYSLSLDGSQIIYSRMPEGPQYDSYLDREVWLHDITAGASSRLTSNRYRETSAKLSPSGSQFAYLATVNKKGEGYYEDNLFVQDVGTFKPRLLMPDQPMEILDFAWHKNGQSILFLANTGLRSDLFSVNLKDSKWTRLTNGDHAIAQWQYHAETGRHVALIVDAKTPGEVHIKPSDKVPFRKVTSEYDRWSQTVKLPKQTAFSWTGRDGTPLEGLLVHPVGYQSGEKVPLVTITHGGPRTSSQFGAWNRSRYVSVLAHQGYAIFLPNHRGGTGYGDAFMRDMVGNYFNNAHLDILDGIDALISTGIADPDRLIKMGWSAGGHMTNKMITFTNRFKAASSGAGASDWISMYGESDVRHNRTPWFGGSPWQKDAPIENYVRQSPLKDAWKVKTPTLFFNGERDVRVPPTQEIMMYRGVRAAGVPTELYIAPGEPHGFRKPLHQLFKINKELEWFAKYVLETNYTPVLPPLPKEQGEESKDDCSCEPEKPEEVEVENEALRGVAG